MPFHQAVVHSDGCLWRLAQCWKNRENASTEARRVNASALAPYANLPRRLLHQPEEGKTCRKFHIAIKTRETPTMLRYQTKTRSLVTTVARSPMQKMPLLEITRVVGKMRLAIQSLALLRHLAHPAHHSTVGIRNLQIPALLSQLLRHSLDINLQIVSQKRADLRVLMVADQGRGLARIRGINVDVCGRVAVRTPSRL